MADVKPPRRKRDRDATRVRMVRAAGELFRAHGYARTTITDIAAAAAVAPQTVYWAFGSKAAIVREIREAWLHEAQTGERLRAVLEIEEPGLRLAAFAAFMRHQWETGAVAVAIQDDAAHADPDVAADVAATLAGRAAALFEVVRPLDRHLAKGLTVERAHHRLLALSLVQVYLELQAHGWTGDDYERWLAASLQQQLLRSAASSPWPTET